MITYEERALDALGDPTRRAVLRRLRGGGRSVGSEHTLVELEHRHLDRYGARRDEMRRIFDTEGDWGRLLEAFARAAAGLAGDCMYVR